ncbi:WD40-repeat-containing domain [Pseudocohnilembus persalinus]|uniref:WD40-repeat-containing domain n=1 Tax=Pseudocohnilembus persalinus TaxID=266149 RepID=A0A0V0QM44_PSEPJ|nr:WD40-repeat-containing domain [Pseudocohnilembus persalinus]|eukprot:KRX03391.1 WD40-repeat-containing domain [Pseudocohnilembus persalinus]
MKNTIQEPFKVNRVFIPQKCAYQMNNLACTNEHLVYTNTYDPMRICHYIIQIHDPTEIKNYYTDFTIFGYGDTFQEVLCYSTSNGNLKYINFSNNQFQNSTLMISLNQNSINGVYTMKAVPELKCLFISDKNGQLAKLQFSNINDYDTTIKTPSNNTCPITVMETLHSQKDEWNLVTGDFLGSEDTYLNFWNLNNNNEIQLKVSYRLADQIVVGIQQIQQCKYVFVTTLESQEMTILIQQK